MHKLEPTQKPNRLLEMLEHNHDEIEILKKELARVIAESTVEYEVPCTGGGYRSAEAIKVEVKPSTITTRLSQDIEDRVASSKEILAALNKHFTYDGK